jgi:predicted glycosyltransferase involved in capsule biosynthesis
MSTCWIWKRSGCDGKDSKSREFDGARRRQGRSCRIACHTASFAFKDTEKINNARLYVLSKVIFHFGFFYFLNRCGYMLCLNGLRNFTFNSPQYNHGCRPHRIFHNRHRATSYSRQSQSMRDILIRFVTNCRTQSLTHVLLKIRIPG